MNQLVHWLPSLLLDIKVYIAASGDSDNLWYLLWLCDTTFREYANTPDGCKTFRVAFTKQIVSENRIEWRLLGKLHQEDDLPACVTPCAMIWCKGGMYHRVDKPAYVGADGTLEWHLYNKIHRIDDKPAKVKPGRMLQWRIDGLIHRIDDKPSYIEFDGSCKWYWNNHVHRDGGPASISNHQILWMVHDEWHRFGGPSVINKRAHVCWWFENGENCRVNYNYNPDDYLEEITAAENERDYWMNELNNELYWIEYHETNKYDQLSNKKSSQLPEMTSI